MKIALELNGSRFLWEGCSLSAEQVIRWLKWRRPAWVEVRHGQKAYCFTCRRFLGLARRPAALLGIFSTTAGHRGTRWPEYRQTALHLVELSYRVLGVAPGTDGASVKRAYRKLAKLYHPDCGGALEKMQELNAAYRIVANSLRAAS